MQWQRLMRMVWLVAVCLGLMLKGQFAQAAPMHVMESRPSAEAVMDGKATEFFIHFDGPVDHKASRLTVLENGRIIQTLHPRLQSQPNVLYSGVRQLPPGAYTLHWDAKSMHDHEASQGDIPFTVR